MFLAPGFLRGLTRCHCGGPPFRVSVVFTVCRGRFLVSPMFPVLCVLFIYCSFVEVSFVFVRIFVVCVCGLFLLCVRVCGCFVDIILVD